jgi:hypothetical protein
VKSSAIQPSIACAIANSLPDFDARLNYFMLVFVAMTDGERTRRLSEHRSGSAKAASGLPDLRCLACFTTRTTRMSSSSQLKRHRPELRRDTED